MVSRFLNQSLRETDALDLDDYEDAVAAMHVHAHETAATPIPSEWGGVE